MKQRTMKAVALTLSVALASLTAAAPVLADDDHGEHGHAAEYHGHGHDRGNHGRAAEHRRDDDAHGHWHRGERLPEHYRGEGYEVRDWRAHHLHAPGRGERWVRVDGDYVLMAVTTGVILSIIAAQH